MASRSTPDATARPAQRRRTRRAIIAATMRLLSEGKTPTIDQIATAADVARRTIYTHFPTLDQLILEASMGAMADTEVETEFEPDADGLCVPQLALWNHDTPLEAEGAAKTSAPDAMAGSR